MLAVIGEQRGEIFRVELVELIESFSGEDQAVNSEFLEPGDAARTM